MAIKMRENHDKNSVCQECGAKYQNTKQIIDILLVDQKYTLCYKCYDILFKKLLRMQCDYQAKLKSKEDIERSQRENKTNDK